MSDNECQSRFITYNRSITPVQDVNNGGSCSGVQAGDKQKLFVLSAEFCYDSKTALKNSLLIFRKRVIFILENANDFFQLSVISSPPRKPIWTFWFESLLCFSKSIHTCVWMYVLSLLKNGKKKKKRTSGLEPDGRVPVMNKGEIFAQNNINS